MADSFAIAFASFVEPSDVQLVVLVFPVIVDLVDCFVAEELLILFEVAPEPNNQLHIDCFLLLSPLAAVSRIVAFALLYPFLLLCFSNRRSLPTRALLKYGSKINRPFRLGVA